MYEQGLSPEGMDNISKLPDRYQNMAPVVTCVFQAYRPNITSCQDAVVLFCWSAMSESPA